jgi:tetratricopeptide (TPR) repeat protein
MTDTPDDPHLTELEPRFLAALSRKAAGDLDAAEEELRAILRLEPRLPEPHLELGRLLLDTDRLDDAEDHVREALRLVEAGGQWTDEIPEAVLEALTHATLAEVLRRRADDDDVIFGDAAVFRSLVDESRRHFARAAELDPQDEYASYHAFFMGLEGKGVKVEVGPPLPEGDDDEEDEDDA